MKDKIKPLKMENKLPRRTILGALTGVGALAVWHKPIIDSVVLPVHAQMSVFIGQYINNNIGVTIITDNSDNSIMDNIVSLVVPKAYAGHETPEGGHIVVDISELTFDAFVITEDTTGGDQQFAATGGAVDGAALRMDVIGGDVCNDTNYVELSVLAVDATSAMYQLNGFRGNGTQRFSSTGTIVTGLTPPADLTTCMMAPSDIRLKTNISQLDQTETGLQLYSFQYLDDTNKTDYVGVMAQDLLENHADTLVTRDDGFYMVNYHKLGLQMTTLEQWNAKGLDSVKLH